MEQRRLWNHLCTLHSSIYEEPWLLSRDFNIVASTMESSPIMLTISVDMKEFADTLIQLSVHDHAFTGPLYTWSNHQLEGPLVRKLDRVLINDNWLPSFGQSMVEFLAFEVSDHCPALIMLQ